MHRKIFALATILLFTLSGCGVIVEEIGPRAILKKYGWFKDARAKLEAMRADITVYESRLEEFDNLDRLKMDRTGKIEKAQVTAELVGLIAAYNGLAAEYNAAHAKINYAFADAGNIPEGETVVLPRNYADYKRSLR